MNIEELISQRNYFPSERQHMMVVTFYKCEDERNLTFEYKGHRNTKICGQTILFYRFRREINSSLFMDGFPEVNFE